LVYLGVEKKASRYWERPPKHSPRNVDDCNYVNNVTKKRLGFLVTFVTNWMVNMTGAVIDDQVVMHNVNYPYG